MTELIKENLIINMAEDELEEMTGGEEDMDEDAADDAESLEEIGKEVEEEKEEDNNY